MKHPNWPLTIAIAAFLLLGGCLFVQPALPHDHNRANDEWFKSLRSTGGMACCDGTDAQRVDDLDWKAEPDEEFPFSVRIDGKWVKIRKDQVITAPNITGHALLFIWNGTLTCFAPGSLT